MSVNETNTENGANSKAELKYKVAVLFFCVAVNYIGSVIAFNNSYRFLFLDMIGTFVAAVVFGPVFAVATALLTNTLTSFTEANLIHFAFANAAGGLYWAYAAQHGWLAVLQPQSSASRTLREKIRPSLHLILYGGGGACVAVSLVAVFLKTYVFAHDTASYGDYIYKALSGPEFIRSFLADLILSFPDKALVVIAGCVLVQSYLRFTACQLSDIEQKDRTRLAAANATDLYILCPTLVIYLAVLGWRHFQLHPSVAPASAHLTVGAMVLALFAALIYYFMRGWKTRHRHATSDLFEAYARQESRPQAAWFVPAIVIAVPPAVLVYPVVFYWLGKTPLDCYIEKPWPITPSWTVVPVLVLLGAMQAHIARYNEHRAAEIAKRAEAAARERTAGIITLLGHQVRRALSIPRQTAQELAQGWEANAGLVEQIRRAARSASHEIGSWEGQALIEGRPLNPEEQSVCRGVIRFVQGRLKKHYERLPELFDFDVKTKTLAEVADVVRDVVQEDLRAVNSEYITLRLDVDESLGMRPDVQVRVVPSQIGAIIYNLVDNSARAIGRLRRVSGMDSFPRLILVKVAFDGALVISVQDEGGGFDPERIDDLYVKRVVSSRKDIEGNDRWGEGTMLIQQFANQMSATITKKNALSAEGLLGACTSIHFPASPSASSER